MESKRVYAQQRVSPRRPCPICGHDSYCFFASDGEHVWCMRDASGRRKEFHGGRVGYLHRIDGRVAPRIDTTRQPEPPRLAPAQCKLLAMQFETAVNPKRLAALAADLGVTVASLKSLRIGWADRAAILATGTKCKAAGCWTFPMTDGGDRIIGIRLRTPDGYKYAIAGGDSGVFVPAGAEKARQVVIVEGPTDSAALIDLGFVPIGRPDNQGGLSAIVAAATRLKPREAVIIRDMDRPGSDAFRNTTLGVNKTREQLQAICPVVVAHPPDGWKDVRAAFKDGARRHHVLGWIREARPSERSERNKP